jgi:hypothetical protein
MGGIRPGDPADPRTVCGPLISPRQRARVERYLEIAKAEGGRIIVGGGRPAAGERGYYIEPTLIADISRSRCSSATTPAGRMAPSSTCWWEPSSRNRRRRPARKRRRPHSPKRQRKLERQSSADPVALSAA